VGLRDKRILFLPEFNFFYYNICKTIKFLHVDVQLFFVLQSSGPSDSRRSMMDFLDTIMSDVHSHSEGGQSVYEIKKGRTFNRG